MLSAIRVLLKLTLAPKLRRKSIAKYKADKLYLRMNLGNRYSVIGGIILNVMNCSQY
jgi:hypothetical protein